MKTPIAIVLILVGGVLIVAPILSSQRQLERAASHFQEHGEGSPLPEELRPKPYQAYDWACLATGAVLSFIGIRGSGRSREALPSSRNRATAVDALAGSSPQPGTLKS